MNDIEVINRKSKNDMPEVHFAPPKFGSFVISTFTVGLGVGMLLNVHWAFGVVGIILGLVSMLSSYIYREKW